MSASDDSETDVAVKLFTFVVGDDYLAVEVGHMERVMELPSYTRIPNTPDFVSGVTKVNDSLTLVVDGKTLFDDHSTLPAKYAVVIDRGDGMAIAVSATGIGIETEILTPRFTPTADLDEAPPSDLGIFISAIPSYEPDAIETHKGSGTMWVLSPDGLGEAVRDQQESITSAEPIATTR